MTTDFKNLLEIVTDPVKYKAQLETLVARENKWQEIIGLGETLETVRSKLSNAESILAAAKTEAAEIVEQAKEQLAQAKKEVVRQETLTKAAEATVKAAEAKIQEADTRLAALQIARATLAAEKASHKEHCDAHASAAKNLLEQRKEVEARLEKLKAVMA